MSDAVSTAAILEQHVTRASQALQTTLDDRSQGTLDRRGQPVAAVEYHEGALRALAQLRQGIRPSGLLGAQADIALAARADLEAWHAHAEPLATMSADRRAYITGATDTLHRLIEALSPAPPTIAGASTGTTKRPRAVIPHQTRTATSPQHTIDGQDSGSGAPTWPGSLESPRTP